jgi:hypothetical protein
MDLNPKRFVGELSSIGLTTQRLPDCAFRLVRRRDLRPRQWCPTLRLHRELSKCCSKEADASQMNWLKSESETPLNDFEDPDWQSVKNTVGLPLSKASSAQLVYRSTTSPCD